MKEKSIGIVTFSYDRFTYYIGEVIDNAYILGFQESQIKELCNRYEQIDGIECCRGKEFEKMILLNGNHLADCQLHEIQEIKMFCKHHNIPFEYQQD